MTKLTWEDLLITPPDADTCQRWLAPWSAVVTGMVSPVFLNKFGSWFLRREDGRVEMLDVFDGRSSVVADTYERFVPLVNDRAWQEAHLLSPLVLKLHEAGLIPGAGHCYAIAPPPALGGPNPARGDAIDPRFVSVISVGLCQSFAAQALGVGG